MIFLLVVFLGQVTKAQQSIYSFVVDSITNGSQLNFSAFQGSKILIVNMASQDSSFSQYGELQQLAQKFQGSLIVIVVPSNSFGTEPGDSSGLGSVYTQSDSSSFPVSAKLSVSGDGISPLYQWLSQLSQNGVMDTDIKNPGYKFLISSSGMLVGAFSPRVRPLDDVLINSITSSQ
jgi:glutathione peroxidase